MTSGKPSVEFLFLRIVAGILALVAFLLVGIRLYGYSGANIKMGSDAFIHSLRVLFPFSVGLIFGYMAIKGKMPFVNDKDHDPNNG